MPKPSSKAKSSLLSVPLAQDIPVFTPKIRKLKFSRNSYKGTAAIIECRRCECEFLIIAPDSGGVQRAATAIACECKLDTRKFKEVTVTLNDDPS